MKEAIVFIELNHPIFRRKDLKLDINKPNINKYIKCLNQIAEHCNAGYEMIVKTDRESLEASEETNP